MNMNETLGNKGNKENKILLWIGSYLNLCTDCKFIFMYFQSFACLNAVGEFQDLLFVFAYIWNVLLADVKLES